MSEEGSRPGTGGAPPAPGRQRRSYNRDWTQGSIAKNVLLLASPVIMGNVVNQFDMVVDMVWVARLGAEAVAGVGVAGTMVMVLSMFRMGITVGQRAMVARAVGADNMEAADHATTQALLLNFIYAAFVIIAGVMLAEHMMRLMGVEPEVARQGANYMRIQMFGQAAMSFRMMGDASMQASGDTVTPMKIITTQRALHIVLAPLLIFGWGFFPRLEVSGAALANTMAAGVGAAASMWVLTSGRTRVHIRLTRRFNRSTIWEMLRIGLPAGINSAERSIARTFITRILTTFGTYGVAAHTVAVRIESLTELGSQGLGQAAGVMVGQNLGAGRPDRSYRSAWTALGLGAIVNTILAVLVIWKAESIIRIFSSDPELVRIATLYLRVRAADFVSMCGASVFSQALNTAGDTIPVMASSIATLWGIELPLAYFLPRITGWGIYAVAVANVICNTVRVILYMSFFQWGKWKEKRIRIEGREVRR